MSKIKNYFHDEIEAQALEREERNEPDVEEAGNDNKQGWYYQARYYD
jgi:hypothetical protein